MTFAKLFFLKRTLALITPINLLNKKEKGLRKIDKNTMTKKKLTHFH